jgi:hypothetical protein
MTASLRKEQVPDHAILSQIINSPRVTFAPSRLCGKKQSMIISPTISFVNLPFGPEPNVGNKTLSMTTSS